MPLNIDQINTFSYDNILQAFRQQQAQADSVARQLTQAREWYDRVLKETAGLNTPKPKPEPIDDGSSEILD